jgi:uncharacterized protein YdhG (YjbR/CyaY superfamily)
VSGQSEEVQAILQHVRQVVRESAPHAYPPVSGDARIQKAAAPYAGEKGNLRFPFDEPIPYDLIARITALRVKQGAAKSKRIRRKADR